jgi:HEAT repeat protein
MGCRSAPLFALRTGKLALLCWLGLGFSTLTTHAADALTGKTNREKVAFLNTLIQTKAANLEAVLNNTFFNDPDPELVVTAGLALVPTLKGDALKKAVDHIVEFQGPLPAFNLGRLIAQQSAPDELGTQLATMALRSNWWEQRNTCILIGCAQDARYIPTLLNLYNASPNRVVKLEAILAFSGLKNPQAVKTLQNIYVVAKNDAEKCAVFRALTTCGTDTDAAWILTQCSANGIESVIGAYSAAQLTRTLPKEVNTLLKSQSVYARRAGLTLMQKLATKEQWLETLKGAKGVLHPEVLEAIGNYFAKNPTADAARLFFDTADNCGAKDYRVPDAWCKALGACAALGDDPIKDHAYKVLNARVLEILGPAQHDARAKERRETSIAAIYGLSALGTPAARNLLINLAVQSGDNVAAIYAAYEVMRDPDPSAAEKFRTGLIGMRDKGRDNFLRAADLLGCMTDRGAVEALFDFLSRAGDPASKTAVRNALSRATGHDFGADPAPWQTWWKAENSFRFLEAKFQAIKKGDVAPPKHRTEGSYDMFTLDFLEPRKDIPSTVTRFNGDEATENAVTAGLRWLAEHQDPDGKWNGTNFIDLSYGKKNADVAMKLGRQNIDISLTGLSVLAFLASNHTQAAEKSIYRETLRRAMDWMLAHQLDDGALEEQTVIAKGGLNYFNYEQGIATLMLSEDYAMTKDEAVKAAAQRGLDKIFSSQTPGEGWRYVPRLWTDVSVVGWMVMAIKSGLMAGLEADPRSRISTLQWFEALCTAPKFTEDPNDVTDDYDKSVGVAYKDEEATGQYMTQEPRFKPSGTAIAGVCRIFLGFARSHPFCIGAANLLKKHLPQAKWHANADTGQLTVPIYYYYYGTIFMHQIGGDDWAAWNAAMKPSLIGAQLKAPDPNAGAYPAKIGFDGDVGGQIYSTSMCVLTLETYYRYLPMLWFR